MNCNFPHKLLPPPQTPVGPGILCSRRPLVCFLELLDDFNFYFIEIFGIILLFFFLEFDLIFGGIFRPHLPVSLCFSGLWTSIWPPPVHHLASGLWPLDLWPGLASGPLVSTWPPHGLWNSTWSPSGLYLASGPPPGLRP